MTELLTAAQMRALENAAIKSGEVTGLELMERAGRGVVEAILEEWPEMALTAQKAVVLCGPGNNGGDGFVVARLLKQRGWEVAVFLYGEVEKLPPDAKVNAERWLEMGEIGTYTATALGDLAEDQAFLLNPCLLIDAMFGTGLARALDGSLHLHESLYTFSTEVLEARRVAIDLPSGLCADSGRYLGNKAGSEFGEGRFEFELTVSFHSEKCGHRLAEGPRFCGKTVVADIGIERVQNLHNTFVRFAYLYAPSIQKLEVAHKFSHGHALILSGPAGRTGAARLAARGALRIGAGVVSVACPQEAMAENAAQLTAIMLSPVEDADALHAVLQDERINALCLGPALGHDFRARELVATALASGRPLVLDADAISQELIGHLHKNVVLTPHAGEFKRMFPDIMAKLEAPAITGPAYSKLDATREAAKRAGCTVLFKGADTVIADETGRAAINSAVYERAAPWLATAGAGDVLAGFITGLLARGFAPMQAAETAAWLHVECALKFGPGLIAEDIPEQLPAVFRGLSL